MADATSTASLNTDVPNRIFFDLNEDIEWVPQDGYGPDGEGLGVIPESLKGKVDFGAYFNGQHWTHYTKSGPFHLLRIKFEPNFNLPRHYHNMDQVVFVLKGEAWQGNRRFGPGEGWSTPAEQPYQVAAGPDGLELVEVRHEPLENLTTHWLEENPDRWAPRQP